MPRPAAKAADGVTALDLHIEVSPQGPTVTVHRYRGTLSGGLSPDVLIEHRNAATVGSESMQDPPHVPQVGSFLIEPDNRGVVVSGAPTVLINNRRAARHADAVKTCDDLNPLPMGTIAAESTVLVLD